MVLLRNREYNEPRVLTVKPVAPEFNLTGQFCHGVLESDKKGTIKSEVKEFWITKNVLKILNSNQLYNLLFKFKTFICPLRAFGSAVVAIQTT